MDKEGVVTAIKNFILPELKEIKDNQAKMSIRLDAVEKRLSDINGHLVDQSRRIDETNKRIDEVRTELSERIDEVRTELTGRIDVTNNRIDQLTFQVGKIAQEMERIKREESVTSDILTRLRALEQKTAHL
ncbi:MAG TPA: hypothetical protein ENG63_04500 [Candidatus Desulfofervidus auxilii]|uniref:Uncharacterized protein n=1 Tax=Desulfofervidus auxilii TaxID=1621989 RepID=A0A7C0U2A5_DESA2|nr:hypothetical protein [Candidatus Desulfofervidus auxilii]